MRVASPPFTVVRAAVEATAWVKGEPGNAGEPLRPSIPDWDPSIDLSLHTEIVVHTDLLAEETGLAPGSLLRLAVAWHCESTRTRDRGAVHTFELPPRAEDTRVSIPLGMKIHGPSLARAVVLEARLLLVAAAEESLPTSARVPGSVLWYHAQHCELEQSQTRFPIEWVDFGTSIHGPAAAWVLDWNPQDLEGSTLGSVRILLNQKHPKTAPLLRQEPPTELSHMLWETIRFDVARQLIEGALSNDEFVGDPGQYEDGTLGATLRRMLSVHFPQRSAATLVALQKRSRVEFEGLLQAKLGLYGGE